MKVLGRIIGAVGILLCIFGGMGVYKGFQERKLAAKSTPTPLAVDLASIEAGQKPASNYLKLGPHYAYYGGLVYWHETDHGITSVKYSYYPIVSQSHADAKTLNELSKNRGTFGTPGQAGLPKLDHFMVLVKTNRYKKEDEVNNLPLAVFVDGAEGMVVNDVESLKDEEKNLIVGQFPTFDPNKILIFEVDRKPMTEATALMMMVGGGIGVLLGAIAALAGMVLFFRA